MSRTYKDLEYTLQVQKREKWRTYGHYYPEPYGGAWPGRTLYARRRNRQFRQQCNIAIKLDKELPVMVRCVAWDIW